MRKKSGMFLGEVTPELKCENFRGAPECRKESGESRVARPGCGRRTCYNPMLAESSLEAHCRDQAEEEEQQRSLRPAECSWTRGKEETQGG